MSWKCRIGWHDWTAWRAGGITNYWSDWRDPNPMYKKRRYYRECSQCGCPGQMEKRA